MSGRSPTVYAVDDDPAVLKSLGRLLRSAGWNVVTFASAREFLEQIGPEAPGCAVLDLSMPEMGGLELQRELEARGCHLPILFLTGQADIPSTVQAMKRGAVDFLTKPVEDEELLAAVRRAVETDAAARRESAEIVAIRTRLDTLTPREREVLEGVVSGKLNKQIAADLGTVEKTIKVQRGRVMEKMQAASLADLVRLAQRAGVRPASAPSGWLAGRLLQARVKRMQGRILCLEFLRMIDHDAIEEGFARNEFFLEYMPIVSLDDGHCIGAEALTRWRRGSKVVPPCEFIPIMENTPFSGRLTYWVIDTVAAELSGWLRAYPEVDISINVPPEILGRGGLAYAGEKSGLREFARQVILEITERGVPDLLGLRALVGVPDAGVRLALDDVTMTGTNLALLTRCPFTIIKVDQKLIQQIEPGNPQPEWLQGVTALLQSTRLDVVAEGVETAFQVAALRRSGVRLAQGFYFAHPTSVAGLMDFHSRSESSRA
jgi:FixJ family two-component response regulator/EAL domain-containing protein (putative c-di-GMP-specific phosphodiesterase class I)